MISGLALMIQCHLITEDDNDKFISDNQVFQWLVAALDCSVAGKLHHGLEFPVIEIIEVIHVSPRSTFHIVPVCWHSTFC